MTRWQRVALVQKTEMGSGRRELTLPQFFKLGGGKSAKKVVKVTTPGRVFCHALPTQTPVPSFLLDVAAEATSAQRTYFLLAIQLQCCSLQEK